MLDPDFVETIHDEIIRETDGLQGFAGAGRGGLEAALFRIDNHVEYEGLDDIYEIAALYAEAIACGHVFNDGNKRTALTCALTYLERQGVSIPREQLLEDVTVMLATREIDRHVFAAVLSVIPQMTDGS